MKTFKFQTKEGSIIKIDAINHHEANLIYSQKFPNETKDSIKTRFTNKSFSQYEQQQFKNKK